MCKHRRILSDDGTPNLKDVSLHWWQWCVSMKITKNQLTCYLRKLCPVASSSGWLANRSCHSTTPCTADHHVLGALHFPSKVKTFKLQMFLLIVPVQMTRRSPQVRWHLRQSRLELGQSTMMMLSSGDNYMDKSARTHVATVQVFAHERMCLQHNRCRVSKFGRPVYIFTVNASTERI